jgi:hypothetical protein
MHGQRKRACLEQGLSLDLNILARRGIVQFGNLTLFGSVRWGSSPDNVAIGAISADLIGHTGWIQIDIEGRKQRFEVISESRHFGGSQRYFVCPTTGRKASVVWRPPGAKEFRSRQGWGKSVAYITQIGSWMDRAHRGKEKIKKILLGEEYSDEWDLPPKPKWMRIKTYKKYEARFDHYDGALAQGPDGKSMMSRRNEN